MQRVTIIAPMLNEAAHVDDFVGDLAAQDFDGELEIFVADGGSKDGSRERLKEGAERNGLDLTVLHNERRIVAPGLNECIRRATGELIVRLDCHSRYPPDYVRRCAEAAEETGAWNVGGIYEPRGESHTERAVACALSSPFGGVNWTRHQNGRSDADTVYLGAFRPVAFERAGLFDESLVRNQDDELNLRIRLAGGRIVLDPSIRAVYRPRGSFRGVWKQYREYGFWKIAVMRKHGQVVSARSLAPAVFVSGLGVLGAAALVSPLGRRLLAADVALYGLAAIVFASRETERRGEPASLVPTVAAVFPCFHVAYGTGMITGALRALGERATRGR
jgi:glycosyltransferase involved in cell wall biosynthesis